MAPTEQARSPIPPQMQIPYRGPGRFVSLKYSLQKGDDSRIYHHKFRFKGDTFVVDDNRDIQSVYDPNHQDLLECLRSMKCPKDYVDGEHVFVVAGFSETREFFPQPCAPPPHMDLEHCNFVV